MTKRHRPIDQIDADIQAERGKRDRLTAEAEEIHNGAHNRALTDGEQEKFDRLTTGAKKSGDRIAELQDEWRAVIGDAMERGGVYVEAGASFHEEPGTRTTRQPMLGGATRAQWLGETLRSIEHTPHMRDESREAAVRVVESGDIDAYGAEYMQAVADPDYATAFARMVRDPQRGHLELDQRELNAYRRVRIAERALNATTNAEGGFAVPLAVSPEWLLSSDGSISPIRQVASVRQSATRQTRFITTEGVTAGYAAEQSEVDDDTPTIGEKVVTTHRADAWVEYSFEAEGDIPQLFNELQKLFADAKMRLEDDKFANGAGDSSNEPFGFLTAAVAASNVCFVAPTTNGVFGAPDLYKLQEALAPRFRGGASFQASLPILNLIDQFETGNGAKKFPHVGDSPPMLLRRSIYENSGMPSAVTNTNHLVAFADWQAAFGIVDRVGARIETVPHVFGGNQRPTGKRGALLWWRNGADVLVPNALRVLVTSN